MRGENFFSRFRGGRKALRFTQRKGTIFNGGYTQQGISCVNESLWEGSTFEGRIYISPRYQAKGLKAKRVFQIKCWGTGASFYGGRFTNSETGCVQGGIQIHHGEAGGGRGVFFTHVPQSWDSTSRGLIAKTAFRAMSIERGNCEKNPCRKRM